VTATHHVARAVAMTGSAVPAYRAEIRIGRHHLTADEPVVGGGGDEGPSPLGLLLGALAACTATTLRMYAERKGWELTTVEVDIRYLAGDDGPNVIERTITVPSSITVEQRQRFGDIAKRTPVTLVIEGGTRITTTFTSR
jgi:putative redox protein